MKTTISFSKVSDRQDLIPLMETRKQGLEPYMMDRTDMFWATVNITDPHLKAELGYCISTPHKIDGDWSLSCQYGSELLNTQGVHEGIRKKWLESEERVQAVEWLRSLIQAGYFDRGCFGAPNANYARCIHCEYSFEKGTSHPHTYLSKAWAGKKREIIYHHGQMEKTIKERGLTKQGVSALPDIPSLEEEGKLDWHTVGNYQPYQTNHLLRRKASPTQRAAT